jgi:hypothetical protein
MEGHNHVSRLRENRKYLYSTSFFSIIINLTWAILYSQTLENINYDSIRCSDVVEWNKKLLAVSLLSVLVDIIRIIMKLCSADTKSSVYSFLSSMKEFFLGLASLVILIAVTITFRNENEVPFCESLNTLNLYYVIIEWCLLGLVCCGLCFILCCFTLFFGMVAASGQHEYENSHITDYQLLRNDKEQPLL